MLSQVRREIEGRCARLFDLSPSCLPVCYRIEGGLSLTSLSAARSPLVEGGSEAARLSVAHRGEELHIGMRILQLLADELHGLDRIHVGEILAQDPHTVQRGLVL